VEDLLRIQFVRGSCQAITPPRFSENHITPVAETLEAFLDLPQAYAQAGRQILTGKPALSFPEEIEEPKRFGILSAGVESLGVCLTIKQGHITLKVKSLGGQQSPFQGVVVYRCSQDTAHHKAHHPGCRGGINQKNQAQPGQAVSQRYVNLFGMYLAGG
jgi:hypothetical protein